MPATRRRREATLYITTTITDRHYRRRRRSSVGATFLETLTRVTSLPGGVWSTYITACRHRLTHMYATVRARTHTHALRDEVKSLGSATDHRRHRRHRDGHHAEAYHPLDSPVNLPSDRTPSPLIIPNCSIAGAALWWAPHLGGVSQRADACADLHAREGGARLPCTAPRCRFKAANFEGRFWDFGGILPSACRINGDENWIEMEAESKNGLDGSRLFCGKLLWGKTSYLMRKSQKLVAGRRISLCINRDK